MRYFLIILIKYEFYCFFDNKFTNIKLVVIFINKKWRFTMKKSLILVALLSMATQAHAMSIVKTAMSFLKNNAGTLLQAGQQLLMDNSDTIFGFIKDNVVPVVKEKLFDDASTKMKNTATQEGNKQETELLNSANNFIAQETAKGKTPSPAEQKAILLEAQTLANQNKAALEQQATTLIAQKREALKQATYAQFGGPGTPNTAPITAGSTRTPATSGSTK